MPEPSLDPMSLLEEQLPTIDRILCQITRRRRLPAEEGEEFRSFVYQRLLAKDCAILGKFRGKSSWRTFLTVVVQRLFLDFRDHRWGKWRPPIQARLRGAVGIRLARLVRRDGFQVDEAIRILRGSYQVQVPAEELRQWAAELPAQGRPKVVEESCLEAHASAESTDAEVLAGEGLARAERIYRYLAEVLSSLPAEEKLIVKMRYLEGLRVSEIARMLGRPQRELYRHSEAILRQMKAAILKAGCSPQEVADVLAGG